MSAIFVIIPPITTKITLSNNSGGQKKGNEAYPSIPEEKYESGNFGCILHT